MLSHAVKVISQWEKQHCHVVISTEVVLCVSVWVTMDSRCAALAVCSTTVICLTSAGLRSGVRPCWSLWCTAITHTYKHILKLCLESYTVTLLLLYCICSIQYVNCVEYAHFLYAYTDFPFPISSNFFFLKYLIWWIQKWPNLFP